MAKEAVQKKIHSSLNGARLTVYSKKLMSLISPHIKIPRLYDYDTKFSIIKQRID